MHVQALAKFVKCVNWKSGPEARQALELLRSWQPMDVEDALELLGPQFGHPAVRRYAVARLRQADADDLLLYLLQLVQALKYERLEDLLAGMEAAAELQQPAGGPLPGERGDRWVRPVPSLGLTLRHVFSDEVPQAPEFSALVCCQIFCSDFRPVNAGA